MKLNVDKEADALYLRLDSPIVESEEVSPGILDSRDRSGRGGNAPSVQALV